MKSIGRKLLSVILTMALAGAMLTACDKPSSTKATGLVRYSSYQLLKKAIDKSLKASNLGGRNYYYATDAQAEEKSGADTTSGTGLTDHSTTNLQVEGVDEADIVKTDGTYLYLIANGRFIIVDASDPANMKIVSQIQYLYADEPEKNTVTPIEMFLDETNKKITLISYSYDDRMTIAALTEAAQNPSAQTNSGTAADTKEGVAAIAPDYYGYFYGQQNVLVQVIDLADIAQPAVEREFLQEGYYVSARRINEYIYLITNKYVYSYGETDNTDYYIPATKDSEASGEWEMLPLDSILVLPDQQNASFLILSALDTNDADSTAQSLAVFGTGENVYASPTNIYIASSRYTYEYSDTVTNEVQEGTGTATATRTEGVAAGQDSVSNDGTEPGSTGDTTAPSDSIDPAAPADSTGAPDSVTVDQATAPDEIIEPAVTDAFEIFTPPAYDIFTDIYRFGIADGVIKENGSGVVSGYILNQFSMDEYNGYFRIATTTGDTWRTDEYTSMNNVYILDQNLAVAGKIEGLASRETIKSVRFTGEKAYLVTFRTVDPLFVLDLSDPRNPAVTGELKIPGYSEYLHPVSDDIVIGFGKDAFEQDDMAYYLGMKISVFDVSDVTNPKEISTMIIGGRGTTSEVTYNHKALLYSKEENIIGFPITICEVPKAQQSDPFAYGMPTFVGFIVLGLNPDNTLYEKGRVSHYTFEIPEGFTGDYTKETEEWLEYEKIWQNSYFYSVNRGMFIGDTLFTVSNAFVKANSLSDFTAIGEVGIPGFSETYPIKDYYAVR